MNSTIDRTQNARLHQLLHGLNMIDQKMDLVRHFTSGRSASSKELTSSEARELIRHLESYELRVGVQKKPTDWKAPVDAEDGFRRNVKRFDGRDPKNSNESRNPMRNLIRHYCHMLGMVDRKYGKKYPWDYTRMNNFIQNIGANNPRKAQLNMLSYYELLKVCNQVEQVYRKEMRTSTPEEKDLKISKTKKQYGIN